MLSASIADALLFVNISVSGIFHGRFAERLAVNKPCLQIVRHLLWKQTTTRSIRNNKAMFEQQPLSQFKGPSQDTSTMFLIRCVLSKVLGVVVHVIQSIFYFIDSNRCKRKRCSTTPTVSSTNKSPLHTRHLPADFDISISIL